MELIPDGIQRHRSVSIYTSPPIRPIPLPKYHLLSIPGPSIPIVAGPRPKPQRNPTIEPRTNRFLSGSFQVAPGPEHKVTAKPSDARITRSRAQFEIIPIPITSAEPTCRFLPLPRNAYLPLVYLYVWTHGLELSTHAVRVPALPMKFCHLVVSSS